MSASRTVRRFSGRLVAVAAALLLVLPVGAAQAQQDGSMPGKKFAAYEYGWYPVSHVDHFRGHLPRYWEPHGTRGAAYVRTQHGMLTVMSRRHGSTGATLRHHAHDRGRWEIRMRARRYEAGHANYTAAAELIPAGGRAQHCGARNVALASYHPTGSKARFYTRTLPNRSFTKVKRRINLSNDYWHTFAVEVTPRRISWFVDGQVRATERRPAALSGIPLTLRLQLTAKHGKTMNRSRLQVDTVRYFSLKSPNKKSVAAPQPVRHRYAGAC